MDYLSLNKYFIVFCEKDDMLVDFEANQLENFDIVAELDHEVTTKALLNPLILHKVFCSLDVPTLKSVRLVCTLWADVGATYLGKKGRFTLSAESDLTSFLPSLDTDLAKNVHLLFRRCVCYDICKCPPDLTNLLSNFVLLLPQISDQLETLRFFHVNAFEPLQEIWSSYDFRNLTQILIKVNGLCLDKRAPPPPTMAKFRALPNLKVFHVEMWPEVRNSLLMTVVTTIFQNLVNSAPNLEDFYLDAMFYLDLTPCGKLKTFRHNYFSMAGFQLQIPEMTKMLASCRNSVENLTLENAGWSDDPMELNFRFPNLTHLKLKAGYVYNINDSLNVTNLPKLTHFSITSIDTSSECDIAMMLENYNSRHVGITSLHVGCSHNPEIGNNWDGPAGDLLVNMFLAVTELKLCMLMEFYSDFDQYFLPLGETLRSFGNWELTRGQVEFDMTFASPKSINYPDQEFGSLLIIAVLRGMMGWRGLATTSLQFTGHRCNYAEFRLLDEMRDALLSCSMIGSVVIAGFLMDEPTKDNFRTFIRQHNLPITVTD
ncbi:uncharacterized protein LOC110855760 isoform X1 [Folsomia candida]|uniref:uncharacterized protein LOC110855760 isoform X1 n=1 Tax=Folsomia candida TaxID=158441 RepID=UPI001604DC33|nr:uncharacterized protein LOC110855760 isoform X1 [Folsomia candida]